MGTVADLKTKLNRLAELQKERAMQKEVLDAIADDIEDLRGEIMAELTENGLRNIKTTTAMATIKRTDKVTIRDEVQLQQWLQQNRYAPTDYLRLDTTRVGRIIDHHYKTDGEIPAGVEIVATDGLSITINKEAK